MPNEWLDAPYVRVYLTLVDDRPEVWRDDALLAWWLRLLVGADRLFPASAPLPIDAPDVVVDSLESVGIVERVGTTRYRFNGLAALRSEVSNRGRAGGLARARAGARTNAGRYAGPATLGGDAGRSNGDAGSPAGPTLGGVAGSDAGGSLTPQLEPASLETSVPATRHEIDRDAGPLPTVGVQRRSNSSPPARVRATTAPDSGSESGPAPTPPTDDPTGPLTPGQRAHMVTTYGPDDADCEEPDLHPLHHRFYPGVGWVCLLCERSDTRSFDDRFVEAGGSPF